MNGLVIYYSKNGHTKTYAEMIGTKLECDVKDIRKTSKKELTKYDFVVFGSGVYIYKIKKVKKLMNIISPDKLVIYACGGSNNGEAMLPLVKEHSMTKEQSQQYSWFYLPGGMDVSLYKGIMSFVFKMMKRMLEKKETLTPDEQGLLDGINHPAFYVAEEHIDSLVQHIQKTYGLK